MGKISPKILRRLKVRRISEIIISLVLDLAGYEIFQDISVMFFINSKIEKILEVIIESFKGTSRKDFLKYSI